MTEFKTTADILLKELKTCRTARRRKQILRELDECTGRILNAEAMAKMKYVRPVGGPLNGATTWDQGQYKEMFNNVAKKVVA